ncbi:antitoxin family protein [Argonema galeatum]|uniref:antitoxin family protein n=1 Tax=Argonema galeatum TaxID=2942762 RepID=UPI0020114819|nr:antitoxin family protein [Argonema galeatum]MCL1466704.1 antitoxin family protein [Argonema galeatum A003/A1]
MTEIITALYENGVLRPVNPVSLSEGQTVRLRIVPEISPGRPKNEVEEALQAMVDQGKLTMAPHDPSIKSVSEEERREFMEKLKGRPGKPLSEIIIEDRR